MKFNFFEKSNKETPLPSVFEERINELKNNNFSILCICKNKKWISKIFDKLNLDTKIFFAPNLSESMEIISSEYPQKMEGPDLMILEICSVQNNFHELYHQLRVLPLFRNTPILFVAENASKLEKIQGIRIGALDFISPFKKNQELKIKIINILYMIVQIRAKSLKQLKTNLFQSIRGRHKELINFRLNKYNLAPKEKTVLKLVLEQDMEYKEIAQSLDITESGVKKRIHAICQKCGVKGKKDLVKIFLGK